MVPLATQKCNRAVLFMVRGRRKTSTDWLTYTFLESIYSCVDLFPKRNVRTNIDQYMRLMCACEVPVQAHIQSRTLMSSAKTRLVIHQWSPAFKQTYMASIILLLFLITGHKTSQMICQSWHGHCREFSAMLSASVCELKCSASLQCKRNGLYKYTSLNAAVKSALGGQ